MIAATRLGLRLGWSAIRGRAAWIAFANAIGMYVVLLSLAIPTSLSQQFTINQNDRRSLVVLLAIAVALPVVVMLATMSRLSARTRDRRLASLRLMGLRPRDTNIVAAVEASSVAMTGAALGAASFVATSRLFAALLRQAGWTTGTLTLTPQAWVLASGLVFVCATALTVLPARRSGLRNLGQARVGSRGRAPLWRLLPLTAGCFIGAWLLRTRHTDIDDVQHLIWWLGISVLLSGAGVVIATSWVTYTLSGLLSRFPGVSAQLARRGMRAEPARATRVLSGLLISAFIGSAALCVMAAWTNTPTFITGAHDAHHPWISPGLDQQNTPRDLSALQPLISRTQHVRAVLPTYPLSITCGTTSGADCGQPIIGSCADLARITRVTNCSNSAAAYLRVPAAALSDTTPRPATVRLHDDDDTKKRTSVLTVRTSPIVAGGGTTADGGFSGLDGLLFIPQNSPALTELAVRPSGFMTVMDPGMGSIQQLNAAMVPYDVMFLPSPDNDQYQQLLIYRRVMWVVIAGAILMGVLTLAATTLDHRREQRRPLAALTMLGTPGRIIRRTVRLQFVIPLLAGITLAVGAGTLCGAAYWTSRPSISPSSHGPS